MKNRLIKVFISHSLPMVLTTILLGVGAMAITDRFLIKDSENRAKEQMEQVRAYFDVVLDEIDSLSLMFSTNSESVGRIQRLMEIDEWEWDETRDMRIIRSYISSPANSRPYIESIYLYLDNTRGRVLSSLDGLTTLERMTDTGWYDVYAAQPDGPATRAAIAVTNQYTDRNLQKKVLRVCRTVYNTSGRATGIIVLNLLADRLVDDYPAIFTVKGQFLTVSGADGTRLLTLPKETDPDAEADAARFSLISKKFGWKYTMGIPRKQLYRLSDTIGLLTLGLSVFACLLGLLLTYKSNRKEHVFLQNVIDQLSAAGSKRQEPVTIGRKENVFDYLNFHVIKTFIEQDYLQLQKEALEYRTLQMQINPHFLFNTLETINWRAIRLLDGPSDITKMISLLSKILKYSMQIRDDSGVPLCEEIRHTLYYLDLQRIRFPDRFIVFWDTEPGTESFLVPRLILQPLLENSLNHGFRDEKAILELRIRAFRSGGKMHLVLCDTGVGISDEMLAWINGQGGDDENPDGRTHIGMGNIRKRIALFYKGEAKMLVARGKDGGTEISISVPLRD